MGVTTVCHLLSMRVEKVMLSVRRKAAVRALPPTRKQGAHVPLPGSSVPSPFLH